MLDQQNRGSLKFVHIKDEPRHVLLLLDVHPGHRLIKEHHLRLKGQCTTQFHTLAQSVGKRPNDRLADMLHLKEVDDLLNFDAMINLLLHCFAKENRPTQQAVLHVNMACGEKIVEHGHACVQGDILECA